MGIIKKVCKNFKILAKRIKAEDKSLFAIIQDIYKAGAYKRRSLGILVYTNYINNPNSYILWDEYIERGMALNDFAFRDALNIKKYLFKRIPDLMKRDYLVLEDASDLEICKFVKKHKKIAGKCNSRGAIGFKSYCINDEDFLSKIRSDKVEILEEWIEQHKAFSKINSSSINTLRIHTLRTTKGCRVCLNNTLSIGSGGMNHNMPVGGKAVYDAKVLDDGRIEHVIKTVKGDRSSCDKHSDSEYNFAQGLTLPLIKEAYEQCLKAAEKVPEFRFIGWDVALTPDGPIIVEGNVLSGSLVTQQILESYINGRGLKQEVIEALNSGMENVIYDKSCNLYSVAFADLSYLEKDSQPTALQQFLVLLESALHNHGIVFFNITKKNATCSITYVSEDNSLKLQKKNEECHLEMPQNIPNNIYEADKLARELAQKVYASLIEMG